MKLILSRKGFDSGSGSSPSPILPDGTLISLPIPDRSSKICYRDIQHGGYNLGDIVTSLTNGRVRASFGAHLDPDLCERCLPRHSDWRPILGQVGAAQRHLHRQRVQAGDLFVFFGLFQEVVVRTGRVEIKPGSVPIHVIWGWLQIDRVLPVDGADKQEFGWALYHPHFNRAHDSTNTVYIGRSRLTVGGLDWEAISGGGRFARFATKLRLTAAERRKCSEWALPAWFAPSGGRPPLTYHSDLSRWEPKDDHVVLKTVGRGQEFVLDTESYPESLAWFAELMQTQR